MKKFIIALLWLIPLAAHAQPEFGLGLRAGGNASTLAEDNRFHRKGVSGGVLGYLQWAFDDRYSLAGQMDLLYTPRGARTIFEGEYLAQTRVHYLDIVLAARPTARIGPASLYLLLGGGLDILLTANKDEAAGGNLDITDGLHRLDVSLLAGAGIAVHLSKQDQGAPRLGPIFLELRHDHGLLDTDVAVGGYKNRNTSLMLGLTFILSGKRVPLPSPPPPPPSPVLEPAPPVTPVPDKTEPADDPH